MGLQDRHLLAEHAIGRDVLQEMSRNSHLSGSVKPIDALPAEGLTLEGNEAGDDLVEDRDIVCKPKLQSFAKIVGFLDLALHEKRALHPEPCIWQDDNPFAFDKKN